MSNSKTEQPQNDNQADIGQEAPDRAPDFSCESSLSFAQILSTLGLSLAITSYQTSRVIVIRAKEDELYLSVKSFPRPMGLAAQKNRLVLGINSQLVDFRRFDPVASCLEPEGLVTSCFTPRSTHVTGMINIHDIAWGDEGLWVVNSAFSCLSLVQGDYSFVPKWKPGFISKLLPEDRCHLNGMAIRDGKPKYVTCFTQGDNNEAWRAYEEPGGLLIDIAENKILLDDLFMPHSPRYYRDKLYFCNSAYGYFCSYDFKTGKKVVELELPGYTRGVAFFDSLAFIGLSKIRTSATKAKIPLTEEESVCGIYVVDLNDMQVVANLIFSGDMIQIYDIAVLELPFCDILQIDEPVVKRIYDFPNLV